MSQLSLIFTTPAAEGRWLGFFFLEGAFKAHRCPRGYVTGGQGTDVRLVLRTDGQTGPTGTATTSDLRLSHTKKPDRRRLVTDPPPPPPLWLPSWWLNKLKVAQTFRNSDAHSASLHAVFPPLGCKSATKEKGLNQRWRCVLFTAGGELSVVCAPAKFNDNRCVA